MFLVVPSLCRRIGDACPCLRSAPLNKPPLPSLLTNRLDGYTQEDVPNMEHCSVFLTLAKTMPRVKDFPLPRSSMQIFY
jgi:hypothetical protein